MTTTYNPDTLLTDQIRQHELVIFATTRLEAIRLATYQDAFQRRYDQVILLDSRRGLKAGPGYYWIVTIGLVALVDPSPVYQAPSAQESPGEAAQAPTAPSRELVAA